MDLLDLIFPISVLIICLVVLFVVGFFYFHFKRFGGGWFEKTRLYSKGLADSVGDISAKTVCELWYGVFNGTGRAVSMILKKRGEYDGRAVAVVKGVLGYDARTYLLGGTSLVRASGYLKIRSFDKTVAIDIRRGVAEVCSDNKVLGAIVFKDRELLDSAGKKIGEYKRNPNAITTTVPFLGTRSLGQKEYPILLGQKVVANVSRVENDKEKLVAFTGAKLTGNEKLLILCVAVINQIISIRIVQG